MTAYRPPAIAAPLGDVVTDRLELRRFRESDLEPLVVMFAEPEVWHYPYDRGLDADETEVFLRAPR